MNHTKRLLSLLLAFILMFSASSALAATEKLPVAGVLKQADAELRAYKGAGSKTGTLFKLAKNEVVLAYETEGSYTKVQQGNQQGYVEKSKLKDVRGTALVKGMAVVAAQANLYASTDAKAKAIGKLAKGEVAQLLFAANGQAAVRAGDTVGLMPLQNLTIFGSASQSIGVVRFGAKTTVYMGAKSSDPKAFTAEKGYLAELLYSTGTTLVVRQAKAIGIVTAKQVTVANAATASIAGMRTTTETPLLSGPSSKAAKLGTLKKGEAVETLADYGTYVLVRAGGAYGLVSARALQNAGTAGGNTTQEDPITTACIEALRNTPAYASVLSGGKPSGQKGTVEKGDILTYLGIDATGGWVLAEIEGNRVFIARGDVKETTKTPAQSKPPQPSAPSSTKQYAQMTVDFINIMNNNRQKNGQSALSIDDGLMQAAMVRAKELVTRFEHVRPDGASPDTVYPGLKGEIIGHGQNALFTAEEIAQGFMDSPRHRAVAMDYRHTRTGAAYYITGEHIYWVQLFV